MVWLIMDIIFRDKYVKYNQISDVSLLEINDFLIKNDNISLELGDNFSNDWAGYSYYYCKNTYGFDDITASAFVYIITWFMTGNAVDIDSTIKCEQYYKLNKIIEYCLNVYNQLYVQYESEIELCKILFERISLLFLKNNDLYLKKTERLNCLLTYKDMELFDKLEGKSRSDKLKYLLNEYYY